MNPEQTKENLAFDWRPGRGEYGETLYHQGERVAYVTYSEFAKTWAWSAFSAPSNINRVATIEQAKTDAMAYVKEHLSK